MRPVVEIGAKWIMSIGIPLPAIEKITLATVPVPVLTTFGGADQADELRLDADLVYTSNYGQTFVARLNQ
jgi:hypothetical protein